MLSNLERLVGKEFDVDEIIIAFESEEEVIVSRILGEESNFEGHGLCDCYNAYEDIEGSKSYSIYVNQDNKIVWVD